MSRSELKSGIAGTGQFCSLDELSANGLFTLEEVTRYTEAANRRGSRNSAIAALSGHDRAGETAT